MYHFHPLAKIFQSVIELVFETSGTKTWNKDMSRQKNAMHLDWNTPLWSINIWRIGVASYWENFQLLIDLSQSLKYMVRFLKRENSLSFLSWSPTVELSCKAVATARMKRPSPIQMRGKTLLLVLSRLTGKARYNLFVKRVKIIIKMKSSWSKLVSTRRSTVLSLPFQLGFPG